MFPNPKISNSNSKLTIIHNIEILKKTNILPILDTKKIKLNIISNSIKEITGE